MNHLLSTPTVRGLLLRLLFSETQLAWLYTLGMRWEERER